ncbi:uncharacterized protein LOC125823532 [Solanum verrucosum]|uniref:uncharacterized protein LOC125823532 n=1 Tax=Solanum verrucosum TaxID=315347 RepID=UPI0020D1F180|nr:uncharacterized protein LOC125823532 [Solanum verrucosum]
MKEGETIHEMHTKLSSITNELRSLGEPINTSKQVRKVLRILPKSWASKVDAITEAKDLKVLTMDALIGNLETHEMNINQDISKKEAKKDKSLVLKITPGETSSEKYDMAYLTKRFQKIVRKYRGFRKGGNPHRAASASDLCHKQCGKAGHFIRDCPILKAKSKEYQRPGGEKDKRRDLVPEKNARKATADYFVKKALAAWGDSSSESECPDDASMLAAQDDANVFDGLFALMEKSADEDNEDKEHLTVLEAENLELKNQLSIMIEKSGKRKGKATSLQVELEANLNTAETILTLPLERNDQMERDLVHLKEELQTFLKWTSSTKLLSNITSQSNCNRKGLGSRSQCWFIDSGFSKHMIGNTKNFLSLKALQGEGVSFGDGKRGYILGVGRVGNSLESSIENVYYVNGLKYSLLSVSQICDKGNEVRFTSENCIVSSLSTKRVILTARRQKNMYVAALEIVHGDDQTCLSAQSANADLWHRRLGHVSSSLLNKLVSRDLVGGLPKLKFSDNTVCDACVKGKQTRSSFKPKKQVSSSRVLELMHMGLCGPVKIQSRNGKKYILVIVDDYSRFTWTMFLKSKSETTDVLMIFFKMIQTKLNCLIAIRSDHGTKFENVKLDVSCAKNGINHNFSAQKSSAKWCGGKKE